MTKKQAAAPPAPAAGLITLVHITRSTVSLQQPAGSPRSVHRIIKRATARSGAYRLVWSGRPSWMPDGGGGIRAGQAWMDAMNNGSPLQCRLGDRLGMAPLQAARPVAVAAASCQLRPKGWEKGWCRQPPPGNVSLYSCRGCCRRDERWNTLRPGVEKRSMILGAGYVQPLW